MLKVSGEGPMAICVLACCLTCLAGCGAAVGIAALIIGMNDPIREECDDYDVGIIGVNFYLQIAGLVDIVVVGYICLAVCILASSAIMSDDYTGEQQFTVSSFGTAGIFLITVPGCCFGLFRLAWAIIGFVIYGDLDGDCKKTAAAEMVLAYSILVMIGLCSQGSSYSKSNDDY